MVASEVSPATRALVIANGEPPSQALLEELAEGVFVVAADGGADVALGLGVKPDAVVGDLDSLSGKARTTLGEEHLHQSEDFESTDLEKAIAFALERGATAIDIVGVGGGRADHALANLSVLVTFAGRADIRVVDEEFEISLVAGEASFEAPAGTVVSLVAMGECRGVTTTNLRWPLMDATLPFGSRGIHNEVVANPVAVRVESGDLLLFKGRWVEKHR